MAAFPDDVLFASLSDLQRRLQAKEFSSKELTGAYLDRLEKLGPRYNALALLLRKPALDRAEELDGDRKRERLRGPLHGIPFAAKDLLGVAGTVTTWGAKPYAAQLAETTASVLTRLDKGGAVLAGKLAMVQLAGGGGYRYAAASLFGPGRNPWNVEHWSGGSSSGSGSAVAAGLVPFALGSETWGSILTPSAYCGVTGLRPTYGLVSRAGAMALSWTMDKIGPMCRTADDCGVVLAAMAGGDNADPGSAGKRFFYTTNYHKPLRTMRVAYHPADFESWAEPAARPAFTQALEAFKNLGVELVQRTLPPFPYAQVASTIITAEGASAFDELIRSGRVNELADARQIAGLKAGLEIPAADYLRAMRVRRLMVQEMRQALTDVDALLSPSRFGPATAITTALDAPAYRPAEDASRGLSDLGAAGNLAGWPALSLPCGFADGLPLALSLVSRPFNENLILTLGRAFQEATDFHRRRPPVVTS